MFSAAIKSGSAVTPTDPQFNYVTMLLHGDGTNGAQNNTFLDSSTNNFTITRNGNTTQGTFTPYGSNWSNFLGGGGNYFTTPASSASTIVGTMNGATNLTIECWIFPTAYSTQNFPAIIGDMNATGDEDNWSFGLNNSGVLMMYWFDGSLNRRQTSATVPLNTWTHIAVNIAAGVIGLFINGISQSLTGPTNLTTVSSSRGNLTLGQWNNADGGANSGLFKGFISNLRVIKASTYTANFTPSKTPLTAITNTSFLVFQSNRFIDNSANALTLTLTGSPSVQRFNPFIPTLPYSTSVIGGSGYFDGSGDNLSIASNANLAIGTGQYTAEFWIYFNSVTTLGEFFECTTTGNTGCFTFYFNGTNSLQVVATGGAGPTTVTWAPTTGQWYHIAATRDSSNNQRIFANGVLLGTATSTNNYGQNGFRLFSSTHNGYITDARLIVGSCLYTSSFIPPTSPLTAVSSTQMLMSYTNAGIFDNAMMNDLETVGNAQISTSVKKYGTGSMYFDGTGDALYATSQATTFGTGDFTLEFWIYFNAVNNSTTKFVYDMRNSGSTTASFLAQESNNTWTYWNGAGSVLSTGFTSSTFAATTWTHVAICRSSGTTKFFVNGTQTGSVADTSSYANSTLVFGARYNYANELNAYIDDLRISKVARYTANFTPPTAAFPNN
jgi:hypothetical protein